MTDRRADGLNYAPSGKPDPVCEKGDFRFAAVGLDHGHIFGMTNGLLEAGGELVWVYDPDPVKMSAFCQRYPGVKPAESEAQVLEDSSLHMVASGAIPSDRCGLGLRVLAHGKDYFADKPPLTTLKQLEAARSKVAETGRKYAVYFSERLHVEAAVYASDLIDSGAIGRVVQVANLAPHRINISSRPDWFFNRQQYGGILTDIGSHQIEQILYYTGAADARIAYSRTANFNFPQHPGFEDFGEAVLTADNGAAGYFRVDWFTPEGLGVWGDGRTFILGTDGYIELRKYIDVGRDPSSDHLYLVNHQGSQRLDLQGQVGFPFFGRLILDCLNRTETAMTQAHAFKAIELALLAQQMAERMEAAEKP
jgi:predicted dehydrogenase